MNHIILTAGQAEAVDAISGRIPAAGELNVDGLDVTADDLVELFTLSPEAWAAEADLTEEYFAQFGDKVPPALYEQLTALRERIAAAKG
jgi:phosphoenolpyruvate carboxykinase (GTP)